MSNQPGQYKPNFHANTPISAGALQELSDISVRRIIGGAGIRVRTFGDQVIIEQDHSAGAAVSSSTTSLNPLWFTTVFTFGGDGKHDRAYPRVGRDMQYELSPDDEGIVYDTGNDYYTHASSIRGPVGVCQLQRFAPTYPASGNVPGGSVGMWSRENLHQMEEIPIPTSINSETLQSNAVGQPFLLEDQVPRFLWYNYTGSPYYVGMYEYGTHGAYITGSLLTKASTTQPVGQGYVTVTTSAGTGALDLQEGSEIDVDGVRYRVSTSVSETTPDTDVDIQLSSNLSVELTGGEAVTLQGSWIQTCSVNLDRAAKAGSGANLSADTFYFMNGNGRGFPITYYLFYFAPVYVNTASALDGVLCQKYHLPTNTLTNVANNYVVAGAEKDAEIIVASGDNLNLHVAVAQDGTVYVIGGQNYADGFGDLSARYGLLRSMDDGETWEYLTPSLEVPDGFAFTEDESYSGKGVFVTLPDGRIVAQLIARCGDANPWDHTVLCYMIDEGSTSPELIKSGDRAFVLRSRDGDPYRLLWGCSYDGWSDDGIGSLYFRGDPRHVMQALGDPLTDFDVTPFVFLRSGGLYALSGVGSAGGSITGTLTSKGSTTQAVGTTTVVLTTGSSSSCDLHDGDYIRIGTGVTSRAYEVTSDVVQTEQSSDVSVEIASPGLTVELVGGESVTIATGWEDQVQPIVASQIHQTQGGSNFSGASWPFLNILPLFLSEASTLLLSYTVSYDKNGAESGSAPGSQKKYDGVTLTLRTNVGNLEKTGYGFLGWNTAANGSGTHYDEGDSYTADADETLYAEWEELEQYAISYNGNGNDSGTAPASQTKYEGVNLTLRSNTGSLAKTGSNFGGWNTAADGSGTDYAEGATYSADAAATMYAKWTAPESWYCKYTVEGSAASNVCPNGPDSVFFETWDCVEVEDPEDTCYAEYYGFWFISKVTYTGPYPSESACDGECS